MKEQEFIRFGGQLVFGDAADSWDRLSPEQREDFCLLAQQAGWETLFVRCLKERLPEKFQQHFLRLYHAESLKRLMESRELALFYQLLESARIPFVPIKGADLAFRIYTDQTLRPHGDWDILFRKADCPRVLQLLQEQGWRTFSGYAPRGTMHHHYEEMHKDRRLLEVHRNLPHFGKAAPEEIWPETRAVTEYHRVLTPEMNLLLLSAHCSGNSYTHLPQWRILLDAGMILKHDPVDWEKVHQLADRWAILRPDILLHIWDGFFPEGVLPPEDPANEQQQLIREIFRTRGIMQGHSMYERTFASRASFNLRWLKERFKYYNAPAICRKYHLPAHQHGKIVFYGIWDFLKKILYCLTHFRNENPQVRCYCQLVARLEKSLNRKK